MSERIYLNEKVPLELRQLERELYTKGSWPNNFRAQVDSAVAQPFNLAEALLRMKIAMIRRHETLDERLLPIRQLLERALAGEDVSVELAEIDAEADERYAETMDRIDYLVAQAADVEPASLGMFTAITMSLAGTGVRGQTFWTKRQIAERAYQRRIFVQSIRQSR